MSGAGRIAYALVLFTMASCSHLISQSKPCGLPQDRDRIARLWNPSGWDVSLVNLSQRRNSEARFDGAIESELALRTRYFRYTKVVTQACDQSATIMTGYIRVEHAYGISASGKTFALVLLGNCGSFNKGRWVPAMCDESVALVDSTGSGKFDLLEIGETKPEMPKWAHRPQ
jgi:hypothetical protein